MSVISFAKEELKRANFGDEDSAVMIEIMERFFDQWDSGGAVHAVFPVLQRLMACKPLTPITDEPDQWIEVGDGVFQHKRMPTVFKDPRFHGGLQAYDIDAAQPRAAITFPYMPDKAEIASPVIEV